MGNLCCNQRATFNCWPKPRTSLRWTLHKLPNTSTFPRTWARRVFIFCTKSLKQWSVSLRLTRKPIWNLRLFILGVMERYFGWSFVCLFIFGIVEDIFSKEFLKFLKNCIQIKFSLQYFIT